MSDRPPPSSGVGTDLFLRAARSLGPFLLAAAMPWAIAHAVRATHAADLLILPQAHPLGASALAVTLACAVRLIAPSQTAPARTGLTASTAALYLAWLPVLVPAHILALADRVVHSGPHDPAPLAALYIALLAIANIPLLLAILLAPLGALAGDFGFSPTPDQPILRTADPKER